MDTIKALLLKHKNVQAGIVYKMYELIKEYLEDIFNYNWMGEDSKLALLGGIMINCDGEGTDMFLPLHFEIRTNKG
jgi:hypothetical protein